MCAACVSPSFLVSKCTTLLNGSSFLQQSDEFIGSFDFGWIFQNQNNKKKLCKKKKQYTCLCACVYRNLVRVVSSASELAFLSSTAYVIFSVGCQITPETKVFPVSQIIIRHHIHPPSWQKQ